MIRQNKKLQCASLQTGVKLTDALRINKDYKSLNTRIVAPMRFERTLPLLKKGF